MSDSDSNEHNSQSNRTYPSRVPADFPLAVRTREIARTIEQITALTRDLSWEQLPSNNTPGRGWNTAPLPPGFTRASSDIPPLPTHLRFSNEAALRQGIPRLTTANMPSQKEPKKPITTLVSTLPETTYKDQDDTKGSEKSLPYIKVQRALLKFLDSNASDTLTPLQARRWTQAIDPKTKNPKAEEALRLCYYMRSQGLDTYAEIWNGVICLFVVNQRSNIRAPEEDFLYWKQDYKTNSIEYTAPSNHGGGGGGGVMRATTLRRNALGVMDLPQPNSANNWRTLSFGALQAQLRSREELLVQSHEPTGQLRSGDDGPAVTYDNDELGVRWTVDAAIRGRGAEVHDPGTADASQAQAQAQAQQQERQDRIAAMTAAEEAHLNNLLSHDVQNPTAVEEAVARIEELQQRLHRV
ncbi:Nn.00g025080.m01.CDS01 [Neocucurbitaria sp. VM-36]